MKNLSIILTLGAVLGVTALAQRPFGPRAAGGSPPDPATIVQNQVARLTTLLSLTAAQASQATTIFTASVTATQALQTTLATNRDSLHTAVKSNSTATIDQLAATIGTLNGQVLAIQSKADAAFYAILTADQQAKYDTLGGPGGPGGPGPRGFGGPPPSP